MRLKTRESGLLYQLSKITKSKLNTLVRKNIAQQRRRLRTRKSIDEAQAYVNTMDAKELWNYFNKTENYHLRDGNALEGFMPFWIGEFYAYYQWYYNLPSAEVVRKIPVSFLKKAYTGLHDLELDLAVKKVGVV